MVELLSFLACQLVDFPDDVNVESEEQEDGLHLRLSVRQSDIGKVIGKQGATIAEIRKISGCTVGTDKKGERSDGMRVVTVEGMLMQVQMAMQMVALQIQRTD